jgi:Ca-activated chloride channel family protein
VKLSTHLSRDRFGWMQPTLRRRDHAVMLVRVAGALPDGYVEPVVQPTTSHLVVVLDRSGSMQGERLEQAKRALVDVVQRLSPTDSFGLVTFDGTVRVDVPAGLVTDPSSVVRRIQAIHAGGSTALGAGLVRGLEEARRLDAAGARVLLVSDGHANVGVTDPDTLGGRVGAMRARGITTSTLGVGLGYDESLLSVIARAGAGNEHFAAEADAAAAAIAVECGELAEQRFLSVRLTLAPATGIRGVDVVNDLPVVPVPGGLQVDLGGMRVDETRSLVVELAPHVATRPGRRKVGKLRLDYVLADDLTDHDVSTTVWTHVGRPDEREAVKDRHVLGEWYVQRVLRRKRRALAALARGDHREAAHRFEAVATLARSAAAKVPSSFRAELLREADEADHLAAPEVFLAMAHDERQLISKTVTAEGGRRARRRS